MANGYRLTGDNYVAKVPAGNDSNLGTTPNSPKTSNLNLLNLVIGSGYYTTTSNLATAKGDGKVILDYGGSNLSTGSSGLVENVEIVNCNYVNFNNRTDWYLNKVKVKALTGYFLSTTNFCANSIFFIDTINRIDKVKNSIFINSLIIVPDTPNISSNSNFFDTNCLLRLNSNRISAFIQDSNINGLIELSDLGTNKYAVQDNKVGTPQDNGYPIGTKWFTESNVFDDYGVSVTIPTSIINQDPKFNNVALEDFSLQADSPHIGRASDGGNIGGTDIANTVLVNQNGVGTIEIIAQPEIETSVNPNFYILNENEDEGYIDIIQRIGTQPIVLTEIEPISTLEFDSDIAGGSIGNQNVPDSEPQTAEYPRKLTTTSLAPDTITLNVTGHDVVVGEFVRVLGEDREVTGITTNTITVDTAFRAAVASGVTFQAGSEVQLAALRPNRLTYQLRVSTQVAKPATDAEWDNNIDPIYNYEGLFSTQEWFNKPGYIIDGSNVYGSGDAEANPAITPDEIAATWINVRVWLRNNYSS